MSRKGIRRDRVARNLAGGAPGAVEKEEKNVTFTSSTTRIYSASSVLRVPEDWTRMSGLLTGANVRSHLDVVVNNTSRALFVASLVLDGYARLCHDRGDDMAFKVGIRQAMTVCVQRAFYPTLKHMDKAFEQLVPELEKTFGVERRPGGNNVIPALWVPNQAITFASNAMWSTTLWLYSTEAIWKHVDAVLKAKFPDLKADQRDRILERLQGDKVVCKEWKEDVMMQAAWVWLEENRGLVARFESLVYLMHSEALEGDEQNMTRDRIMSQAASIRIEMLQLMEEEIARDEAHGQEMSTRFRRFAIIPEFSARRHFVRVDKDVLQDVLQKLLGAVPKEVRKRPRKQDTTDSAPKASRTTSGDAVAITDNVQGADDGVNVEGSAVAAEHAQAAPTASTSVEPSHLTKAPGTKKGRNTRRRVVTSESDLEWPLEHAFDLNTALGRKAFLGAVEVIHVVRLPRSHAKKIVAIPGSFTTDGVQLHVTFEYTFERAVMWPKGKALPKEPLSIKQDVQSKRGGEFAERTHGLFRADCIAMKHLDALRANIGEDFNLVFVDPGVASIFTAVSIPFSVWKARQGKVEQGQIRREKPIDDELRHDKSQCVRRTHDGRGGGRVGRKTGKRHDGNGAEIRGANRAEYYHMVGAKQDQFKGDVFYARNTKRNRRYGWSPEDVRKTYAELSEGGSTHVGGIVEALEAAKKRIRLLVGGSVWRFVSSRTHAQLRFQRTKRRHGALDELANRLAPGRHDVVIMGDWFGRRALKGEDLATPVKTFRRHLQVQRRLLVMQEYNTSCKCAFCGPRLGEACQKVDHPNRKRTLSVKAWDKAIKKKEEKDGKELTKEEKVQLRTVMRRINGLSVCPDCQSCWSRDINAACNFSYGFFHMCTHAQHERPLYLRRPSKQEEAPSTTPTSGSSGAFGASSDCASEPKSRSPSLS